jgi:hypothetical protein
MSRFQRHARLLLRQRPGFSESYNFAADFPASRPRRDAGFAADPMVKRYITQPASPKWPAINKPAPRWLEQTEIERRGVRFRRRGRAGPR